MPDEGWTFETIKQYLESKIDSLKENVALALTNADKAVNKAEAGVDRRLELMNELRGVVEDQSITYLRREAYDVEHKALSEKVTALDKRLSAIETGSSARSGGITTIGVITAAVLMAIAALGTMVIDSISIFRR